MRIHPVIMAGGSGTRFWPLSRRRLPKQFLALASKEPMLVETVRRLSPLAREKDVRVVCGRLHAPMVRRLLPHLPKSHLVVEPVARNTAPAIGLAALHVAHDAPEGVMAVLPSDHHVADSAGFRAALKAAAVPASLGYLAIIGIRPTRPDTGYGYVQIGDRSKGDGPVEVRRFVEKPDPPTARRYLKSGQYLWNAGIFVMRADIILERIARHLPRLHEALREIGSTIGTRRYAATLAREFRRVESISIDYGVMEKANPTVCVPGDFGWSDVGSFAALEEVRAPDERGNVADSNALLVDCKGCVIVGGERTIAAVGLEGLVVVDAGDALLVVPKERSQEVRAVVEALAKRGATKLL